MRIHWPSRYGWPNAAASIDPIKRGIASHVPLEHADTPQPVGNVVLFHVLDGSARRNVIVDYDDQMALHASANHVDLYFKMRYVRHGYGSLTIRPGGYVSPHQALYRDYWHGPPRWVRGSTLGRSVRNQSQYRGIRW
jgi:hypothetical protein